MTRKTLKSMMLMALPLLAVLAIPGEAASVSSQDGLTAADSKPLPQAEFGLLLDPHVEPVFRFAPPTALWDL